MKASGIIAEFNPFHNGHKYIVDIAKCNSDCVVAVISGNYVQRGSPAFFNKFIRTTAALNCGVDLVIELPSPWSASFAQNFATGAISILKELSVSEVYFGAECDNLEKLKNIALIDDIKPDVSYKGTYATARQLSITNKLGSEYSDILNGSNNNLGIEYIKAANKLSYMVNFIPVKRVGSAHDSDITSGNFSLGSHIRDIILSDNIALNYVPEECRTLYKQAIKNKEYISDTKFSNAVISYLKRKSDFTILPELSEGIENRLKKAISISNQYDELLQNIKTKRYTLARVRRLVLSAFLDLDNYWTHKEVPYLNILGFTKRGEKYLKQCSSGSTKPLVFSNKPSTPLSTEVNKLLNNECIRNDIYMSMLESPIESGSDYTFGIIKENDLDVKN